MRKAGARLFVDINHHLTSPVSRKKIIDMMGKFDPLMKDAILNTLKRKDFIKFSDDKKVVNHRVMSWKYSGQFAKDQPIAAELIHNYQSSLKELKENIQTKSGNNLFNFILEDLQQFKKLMYDPRSMDVIMTAMYASNWLNKKMLKWLKIQNAADTLSLSVENNIASEMGLALLDVADVIRPYPEIINYLQNTKDDDFLTELINFDGGKKAQKAIYDYLDKYGMRCAGEIDIVPI